MRTLHVGLRVADPERSLAFYAAIGYGVVGRVPETPIGQLTMLKLPDDEFVSIELVHDPSRVEVDRGSSLSHLVIHVESMDDAAATLAEHGIEVEGPTSPDGSDDFRTAMITDPDGTRMELVQWPAGHPAGMSAADMTD